jgi:hypothetical protein
MAGWPAALGLLLLLRGASTAGCEWNEAEKEMTCELR